MRLVQPTGAVEISGAISTPSRFNITASKEAFKILSSGLYNNKILAIIRELSCNAYDAHVAAGCADEPFELHLPTTFEPTFLVRDHGTGLEYRVGGCETCRGSGVIKAPSNNPCPICGATLSCPADWDCETCQGIGVPGELIDSPCGACDGTGDYDAVKELYCNYFSSNKSNSNLFIGALGLGSKSPFCYTEGFSVKNTYDGMTRIYSCFLNEEGMPAVLLQSIEETPEVPVGVEVRFPVKQKDVWEFENQAKKVLEFFNPRPLINIDIQIQQAEYIIKTETWGLRKNDQHRGKIRAIQGLVAYNIGEIDHSRLTEEQRDLLTLPLDLFFPIGQLSVAASRESLSNDATTIDNILKALIGVRSSLIDDVKLKLSVARSYWEARVLLYSLSNAEGIGKLIDRAYKGGEFNGLYQGWTLTADDPSVSQLDYPHVKIFEMVKNRRLGNTVTPLKTELTRELPTQAQRILPNFNVRRWKLDFSIRHEDTVFVINDIGFGGERYVNRLVQFDEDYKADAAYFITRPSKDVEVETVVAEAKKIVEQLGNPPIVLLSTLRDKYKADMPKDSSVTRDLLWFDVTNHIVREREGYTVAGWRDGWEDARRRLPEPDAVKYYVPVKSLKPLVGQFKDGLEFKEFVLAAMGIEEMGLKGQVVYGVPPQTVSKLDDSWIEVVTYVMDKLTEIMTPERETQLSLHLNPFRFKQKRMLEEIGKHDLLPLSSPLQRFCNEYVRADKFNRADIGYLATIIAKAKELQVYETKHAVDFNAKWAVLATVYPLLRHVDDFAFRTEDRVQQATLEYINLIDARNSEQAANKPDDNQLSFDFQEEKTNDTQDS